MEEKGQQIDQLLTKMFVKQPLALRGLLIKYTIFHRPGVAETVLQTSLYFIANN